MPLTRRGLAVVGAWLLFIGLSILRDGAMTHVSLHYVGLPPPELSTRAVVEQRLTPDRFIPFWSYAIHAMSPADPIDDVEWRPVHVTREGGSFRLPRRRAFSLGGYRVYSNELHVGGARPFARWLNIDWVGTGPGFDWPATEAKAEVRVHFFDVRRAPDEYAVALPPESGGKVTVNFDPVVETRLLEPEVPVAKAGDACDTGKPLLQLRLHQRQRLRYEVRYRSAAQAELPLPHGLSATEVFFNDQARPSPWEDREEVSNLRRHAIQPGGYRLIHDTARREVFLERTSAQVHQVAVPSSYGQSQALYLMFVTPNPVGEYSSIECVAVEPQD